jgi:hypothetical protein
MNRILYCLTLLLTLTHCTIQHTVQTAPQNTPACLAQCHQSFDSCKQECTNSCARCSASSTHTSTVSYMKYVHEKQIEGGIDARNLNSYRDPLQCRKVSCSCSADLAACTQNCTGVIQKRLQPVPYCI